jgi:hypothetical protein
VTDARPRVSSGGIVTVAFLKARLDEGEDQLGIFLPLVLDAVASETSRYFTASQVRDRVAARHGITMPEETVATLLKRATRQRILTRDAGRFAVGNRDALPTQVPETKAGVEAAQLRLGSALAAHARESRGLELSDQAALDLILRFLEDHQVNFILGAPQAVDRSGLTNVESGVVAEFLIDVVDRDLGMKQTLSGILEGLVLYHAAFLPDLSEVSRRFGEMTVVFDTVLVRQALGYEGSAPRLLLRDTIDLLATNGVSCVVFDKSVQEIQRILSMYRDKLATSAGRSTIRPSPMARHFLTHRYQPSDVQEMSAILENEIGAAGLTIRRRPPRVDRYTLDEAKLAARLADPRTHDVTELRIEHDVDCVAGVLTLRAGHRANRIEDARAVFATVAPLVIQNTVRWWEDDEGEVGVPPIIHIRALANLVWLKRPLANPDYQLRELVALCAAAMRPSSRMWRRFLAHLEELNRTNRLTPDQVTAIIVSSVSDRILRSIEPDDPDDVDAGTLDEVVERVMADYRAKTEAQLSAQSAEFDAQLSSVRMEAEERASKAEAAARSAADALRRSELAIDARARVSARTVGRAVYWALLPLILLASIAIVTQLPFGQGWIGLAVGLGLVTLALLEFTGVFSQLRDLRRWVETLTYNRIRSLLGAARASSSEAPKPPASELDKA